MFISSSGHQVISNRPQEPYFKVVIPLDADDIGWIWRDLSIQYTLNFI